MSGRPVLKLTLSKSKAEQLSKPAHSPPPPAPQPQAVGKPKLKLKFGGAGSPILNDSASTPATSKPKKSVVKKPRPPSASNEVRAKPPPKKRARDDAENDTGKDGSTAATTVKRIKFSTKPKPLPSLRLRSKGQPPLRPKGVGYDSEASDTEIDPALEEEFILRMQPGDDCDYLRKAVEENRFGPRSQGGADVSFKSLTRDGRRFIVTIQGRMYAATLVDLPCIVEGLKSWDRRGWYKAADICQMLLVLGRVENDEEAMDYPLPAGDVEPSTYQYAHGLTPPFRWVRKRRFRKRISNKTIEAVEREVARLLADDHRAIEPPDFEILDYGQYMRGTSQAQGEEGGYGGEYDEEQDAEGEVEYSEGYGITPGVEELDEDFQDALAAEMEAELAAHAEASSAAASVGVVEQQATQEAEDDLFGDAEPEATTPHAPTAGESSGDEESGEEPDDANAELDEETLVQQRQLQEQREEIAELEAQLQEETRKWERMENKILKQKILKRVQSLKQALELKKVSIGEGGDV